MYLHLAAPDQKKNKKINPFTKDSVSCEFPRISATVMVQMKALPCDV